MLSISAVVPAYNAIKYLEKAILSLVNQTEKPDEIIIVDDGSQDNTLELINKLAVKYKCIKVIEQKKNFGVSIARNVAINRASGDWVLFLDADDECSETLLETYIQEIEKGSFEAIYSSYYQINEVSQIVSEPIVGRSLNSTQGFCDILVRNPIISPSGLLIKRKTLLDLEGFDTSMRLNEDVDLWVRLLDEGCKIKHVEQPLSFIRRHRNNTTSNMTKSHSAEKEILNKYEFSYIEKKFKSLSNITDKMKLDFIALLMRYEKWDAAKRLLDDLSISNKSALYISYLFLKSLYFIFIYNNSEQEKVIKEILTVNPKHGASLNNLGVLYVSKNEFELAQACFIKALELFPNYIDASDNLKLLSNGINTIEEYKLTKRELRNVLLSYSK